MTALIFRTVIIFKSCISLIAYGSEFASFISNSELKYYKWLSFRAFALRSGEGRTLETSILNFFMVTIYLIKLFEAVSLEANPFIQLG